MELNITKFFNDAAPMDYSASVAEIGDNAGADTWRAACEDSQDYCILDTEEKRVAFRAFALSSGAWNEEEIATWSDKELNALCMQWVSGDMREGDLDVAEPDWDNYQKDSEAGRVSGRIFKGIDGEIYFYAGE